MVGYSFLDDSFIRDSMPVYPGAICPFRRLHTFCLLRPARYYPRFWIWRPSFGRQRDFNPPEQRAAQRTLPSFRRFGRPPRRRISLQCQLRNLHWQDFHLLDHQLASLHYPRNTLERVQLIRRALSVGSSLAKLTTLLKIRDQGRSSLPPGTRYSPVETYGSQRKHHGVGRPAQAARTDSCKIGSETQERAGREASEIAGASGRSVFTGRRIKKWIAHGEKKTGTKITMKTAVLIMSMAVTLAASVPQETQQEHSQHHCQMMHQGEMAMGFSQTKTSHHFQLT